MALFALEPETGGSVIEQVRKHARVLVIDDHAFTYERTFTRDGYHFERWASIRNLSQLTDGHYQLILLDVQGVGVVEDPVNQGFGILDHVKRTNPAQPVILYSSQPYRFSESKFVTYADAFLDKGASYVEFKDEVDRLLLAQISPGYFIEKMNATLGESALLAPRAVVLAGKAFRSGRTTKLRRYLSRHLPDSQTVETAIQVVGVGVGVIGLLTSQ